MARAKSSRRFKASENRILDAVDAAFDDIGAKGVRWSKDGVTARASIGFSFLSYGEDVTADVYEDGTVVVRSESSFPLTIIDWGKNARNCRKLLDAVEDILDDR